MGGQQGILVAGRYHLMCVSGRGGKGTVWRAHDRLLDREVAVKEVRLSAWMSEEERHSLCHRLIEEARATAALRHPGLVTVHDVVQQDGRPWIVMELVEALSLQEILDRDGRLSPYRAAEIGLGVLSALRAAHDAGILHRDVKPSNVLLPGDGRVLLTDFGLAIRTADGTGGLPSEGSPAYVSPEQAWSRPVTEASDLWSLGATLYAAVEGRPPFGRSDPLASLLAVLVDEYEPPTHAGPLRPVIDGLLRRDPAERVSTAETKRRLARLVRRAEHGAIRRRPARWAVTGAITVCLAGLTGLAGLAANGPGIAGLFGGRGSEPDSATLTLQAGGGFHADDTVTYRDPRGFAMEVPLRWRRTVRPEGTSWYDPVDRSSLWICRAPGDPMTGLRGAELRARMAGAYPGYRRLRLERVAEPGRDGAEWEFTWMHTHAMHTRTGGYDLFLVAPDDRWTQGLRGYEKVRRTFRVLERTRRQARGGSDNDRPHGRPYSGSRRGGEPLREALGMVSGSAADGPGRLGGCAG